MNPTYRNLANRYLGWVVVFIVVAIPLFRWFQLNSFDVAMSSSFGFFSMVGRLAALAGIVLYAINFVLSTRLRFLEGMFGGLNRVYISHHIIGGLALIALLIHPLALALRYAPDQMQLAADFLLSTPTPVDWAIVYGKIAFFGTVVLLVITFFVKLPYHLWLFTHKFLGVAFLFGGLHAYYIPSDVAYDPFMRWYILSFVGLGLLAFSYRTLLSRVFVRREDYEVVAVEHPTKDVTHIEMKPSNRKITFKSGQFLFISFNQDGLSKEWHPFSISKQANDKGELSVTVKAVGDFTKELSKLKKGAAAKVEGAFGRFINTRYNQPKQIWVAGGIGITPFLSMAKSLAKTSSRKQQEYDIHLFYVVRKKSELVEQKLFQDLAKAEGITFTYHPYVGDKEDGLITAGKIKHLAEGVSNSDVFLCGPPPMMKGLRKQFNELGVKNGNIHSEEFSIS